MKVDIGNPHSASAPDLPNRPLVLVLSPDVSFPFCFQPTILALLDGALTSAHSIPRVDGLLLTNLRFPKDSRLCSLGLLDPYVVEKRQVLQTGIQKAVIPLRAYLREYKMFTEFYNIKVSDYIR